MFEGNSCENTRCVRLIWWCI